MRGQSHVVGVALMLGLAVVALGTLTLGIGMVVDSQAANADTTRVADDMETALQAVERTGHHSHHVSFAEGQLSTEQRTLRIIDATDGTVIESHAIDALAFENGDRRVTSVGGALVRSQGNNAWLVSEPPISSSEQTDVLVVGAPQIGGGQVAVSGQGGVRTTLQTNISHTESDLGTGEFAVAIETETPTALEPFFERQNATTSREMFAGDKHESIVATYPGQRQGYLVVHTLNLEVTNG